MKYEKKIMELLSNEFKANLSEDEWQGFLEECNSSGYSIQQLSDAIEQGVKKGFSVEYQMNVIVSLFSKLK